jgi:putative transposase
MVVNIQMDLSKPIPTYMVNEDGYLKSTHQIKFNGINYYLHICVDRPVIVVENRKKIVATDPGVRKMITTWDTKNVSYMFGSGKSFQMRDLLKKRDKCQSRGDKRNYIKLEIRIHNLMNELHHKTGTFLCKRYRNIILPELGVTDLVKQVKSKAYRKSLLRMKLYEFNNLLKTKGELYNTNVVSKKDGAHERYSSRLCSGCRFINPKSSSELKICKNCNLHIDRDINAAINIYYFNRHLVD